MRKTVYLLASVMALSLLGCKKGPNDPSISLRARDARIRGTWELKKVANSTTKNFYISNAIESTLTETTTETFDGTTWTATDAAGGVSVSDNSSYALEMSIEKDGTLSAKETDDGRIREFNNDWFWLNSKKNKSEISLGMYGAKRFDRGLYSIDRLSNKELILTYSYREKDIDSSGDGYETTVEEKWTFEKKK